MSNTDDESAARREASKEQLNAVLGKHGWRLGSVVMSGPAVVEYRLVRTDGRTAAHRVLLSDLLMSSPDTELGVNLLLALHLLVVVKSENEVHPMTTPNDRSE